GSYTILVELAGLEQRTSHDIIVDEDTELIEGKDYVVNLGDNPDIEAVLDHTAIKTVSREDQVELSPNPAREMIVLRSAAFNDGPVYISLYTEDGNLVRKQKVYVAISMTNEIFVPLDGLSAGSYLIRVQAGNMLVTKLLLVLD
ncbi:MAG: T9SS type A sorting domain-containing protein, partial [Bacteroidales bacterium]